jgi:hypothetical protein
LEFGYTEQHLREGGSQGTKAGKYVVHIPFEQKEETSFGFGLLLRYAAILLSNFVFISSNWEYLTLRNLPIPSIILPLVVRKSPWIGVHHMSERGFCGSIGMLGMAPRWEYSGT